MTMLQGAWKEPEIPVSDEDLFGEEAKVDEVAELFVVFRLSEEWFALRGADVQEVAKVKEISYLPGMSSHVMGVANIRGTIVLVIDPKKLLGLRPISPAAHTACIVVVNLNDVMWGVLTDEVADVISISSRFFEPPPLTLDADKARIIQNIFYWKNRLIAMLRVDEMASVFSK